MEYYLRVVCPCLMMRARNVAFGIGVLSLDLKIWHFFPDIVTTMGLSRASCDGVFTNLATYAAGEDLFRIFSLSDAEIDPSLCGGTPEEAEKEEERT
ncbi:hypothetical protein DVH24_041167 [Malus domestica]|uniref:Uncharacterized protein n=1 Tax=Malus domestica TaxID=3750 RepID=A0A498IA29_MALDO|nr:hypothetical protein DVH24_041167 [Malus domestica]